MRIAQIERVGDRDACIPAHRREEMHKANAVKRETCFKLQQFKITIRDIFRTSNPSKTELTENDNVQNSSGWTSCEKSKERELRDGNIYKKTLSISEDMQNIQHESSILAQDERWRRA